MLRWVASIFIVLAMVCSPVLMAGDGMAMAQDAPAAAMSDGCAGMNHDAPDEQKRDMETSCAAACAALPAHPVHITTALALLRAPTNVGSTRLLVGIMPEAQTPPPRISPDI